ncbi:helix-turn-helix domain-containing protein [uncultured Methylobacterium sp.]|jgi:transcriptional regulator with XRE-family HTH domain|uniref:helix-turn-helix domain-containing protein n=1 Tax=uncultured Methylobacterium sp. TaxID=157278 RepID=UPI002596C480|nr:helix-turn-helix domain-containing protein [uncultured Methylobacterium sp.]
MPSNIGRATNPPDADRSLGNRIRAIRKARGVSQKRLASAIGVSWQQLLYYEHGRSRVGIDRLHAIAVFLAAPIALFFAEDCGEVAFSEDELRVLGTAEALELLKLYANVVDIDVRQAIGRLVEASARIDASTRGESLPAGDNGAGQPACGIPKQA